MGRNSWQNQPAEAVQGAKARRAGQLHKLWGLKMRGRAEAASYCRMLSSAAAVAAFKGGLGGEGSSRRLDALQNC